MNATKRPVHIALIEDDRGFRTSLSLLIDGTPGLRCAGAAGSIDDALRTLQTAPDVILLDIQLPGISGAEGLPQLLDRWPEAIVIMLTSFSDDERIFQSICNGASGYLLKKTPPARLIESVTEAKQGGAPMSPEVARRVLQLFNRASAPKAIQHDLTPQELRLLRLLAEGCSYEVAGDQLCISVNTVRNYVRSIYEKLHVHSKSEAVSKALRAGII